MKKPLAVLMFVLAAFVTPALAAGPQVQAPKILVIDRTAILTRSKVGQDVARQTKTLSDQVKADLSGQAKALQAQEQALSQQVAILAPDVKNQKIKDFEAKQAALQNLATKKQEMLEYSLFLANQQMAKAVEPIVKQVMQERGANMVLDRNSVVSATDNSFDITQDVINRLDQKLTSLKVTLTSPPAGAAAH
jgi:outer membrane protein